MGSSCLATESMCIWKSNNRIWKMAVRSFSINLDLVKTIRKTNILLRIFICFDVFFLLGAIINQIWYSPSELQDLGHIKRTLNICIILFFTTSLICNRSVLIHTNIFLRGMFLGLPYLEYRVEDEDFSFPGWSYFFYWSYFLSLD